MNGYARRRILKIIFGTILVIIFGFDAVFSVDAGDWAWGAAFTGLFVLVAWDLSRLLWPDKPRDRSKTIRPRWKL